MILTGTNVSTRRKPRPLVALVNGNRTWIFFRDWTWVTVVTERRLTTWTMARPRKYGLRNGSVGYLPPFHHRDTGFDLTLVHMDWGVSVRLSGTETDGSTNISLLTGSIIPPMLYINRSITDAVWVIDSDVEYTEKGVMSVRVVYILYSNCVDSTGWYIYN